MNLTLKTDLKIVNIFGNDIQLPSTANVVTITELGNLQWFNTPFPNDIIPYEDCGIWGPSSEYDENEDDLTMLVLGEFSSIDSGIINYIQFNELFENNLEWTTLKINLED